MKILFLLSLFSFSVFPWTDEAMIAKPQANYLYGVFDGRTPCDKLANQLNEKVVDACIKIKWRLSLYKDSATGEPSNYELLGFMYKKGNPRIGKWHILKGSFADADAIIYRLDREGEAPLLLQKGNENVLFFLDAQKKLLVGNRDFSYTLNRKKSLIYK